MSLVCQGCGCSIEDKSLSYRLRLELYASPDAPVFSAEDLEGDLQAQWKALIDKMEAMSDKEVEEATDQVYESYEFLLCPACRRAWHERLKEISSQFQKTSDPESN